MTSSEEEAPSQGHSVEKFGKYLLYHPPLGQGGMAQVFLAELQGPEGFGKHVALKRLWRKWTHDKNIVDSFVTEAKVGALLNHPNIVQTLNLGRIRHDFYMTMEYVEGITLGELLHHQRRNQLELELPMVKEIIIQLCEGLEFAHRAVDAQGRPINMIHRDLKPENILISVHGYVKVTDFGIAKVSQELRSRVTDGLIKGTVAYMAPEQAAGETLDPRTDLYSMGLVMFEMLTLEALRGDATGYAGLVQVLSGEGDLVQLDRLEGQPAPLIELVSSLLQRDPAQRPACAGLVGRSMAALCDLPPAGKEALGKLVRQIRNLSHFEDMFDSSIESWVTSRDLSENLTTDFMMDRELPEQEDSEEFQILISSPASPNPIPPLYPTGVLDAHSGGGIRLPHDGPPRDDLTRGNTVDIPIGSLSKPFVDHGHTSRKTRPVLPAQQPRMPARPRGQNLAPRELEPMISSPVVEQATPLAPMEPVRAPVEVEVTAPPPEPVVIQPPPPSKQIFAARSTFGILAGAGLMVVVLVMQLSSWVRGERVDEGTETALKLTGQGLTPTHEEKSATKETDAEASSGAETGRRGVLPNPPAEAPAEGKDGLALHEPVEDTKAEEVKTVETRVASVVHNRPAAQKQPLPKSLPVPLPPPSAEQPLQFPPEEPPPTPFPVANKPTRTEGTLTVNSVPFSYVYVNGRNVGTTPLLDEPIPAGRLEIKLVTPDGKTHTVPRQGLRAGGALLLETVRFE